MAMAYAAARFCFFLTFLNLISIGLAAIRARPRPAPLPPPRAAPGLSVVRPLCGFDKFSAKRHWNRVSGSIIRPMRLFFTSRGQLPLVQRLIARHPDRLRG
jgi:ceramide glucosyltransferase